MEIILKILLKISGSQKVSVIFMKMIRKDASHETSAKEWDKAGGRAGAEYSKEAPLPSYGCRLLSAHHLLWDFQKGALRILPQ